MQAVIGTQTGESYQIELDDQQANALTGKQIGDDMEGSLLGLSGYTLQVTGGSDRDGFPMRDTIQGTGRRRILLTKETGGHGLRDGERRRKTVRGNTISDQIEQVNLRVVEEGSDSIEELLNASDEDETEETDEDE